MTDEQYARLYRCALYLARAAVRSAKDLSGSDDFDSFSIHDVVFDDLLPWADDNGLNEVPATDISDVAREAAYEALGG